MVHDDNGVAGVVDLQRVAGAVILAHGDAAPLAPAPAAKQLAELAEAVAAGIGLQVLAPDQLQRQVLVATQLALDLGPVGQRSLLQPLAVVGAAKQRLLESLLAQLADLRPASQAKLGRRVSKPFKLPLLIPQLRRIWL